MSSMNSLEAQKTSICSVPSTLPSSVSVLTRCPDPDAHGPCRPPTVLDPDIPGATWVLCHTWVQVMPATTSESPQISREGAKALSEVATSLDQDTVKLEPRMDTISSGLSTALANLEIKIPTGPALPGLGTSRTEDSASVTSSTRTPTKGTAPVERDCAMRSQCPAAHQWKEVYEALDKAQPPQAPVPLSNCSRNSKAMSKPAMSTHVAPARSGILKAALDKATSLVISDESSDSGDDQSVHTDTTDERLGFDSKAKGREILPSESVSRSGSPLAWADPGIELRPAISKAVGDNDRSARDTKSDIGKTRHNLVNALNVQPGASLREAKRLYIEKSGKLLQRMQDMRTDEAELDDLFQHLKDLRYAYRLTYLTHTEKGSRDNGYEGDGDTSSSTSPDGSTIVRDEWTRSERPTPHPKKYVSPAPKRLSKTRFA